METKEGNEGIIKYDDISWTKKNIKELFEIGDVVYVEKITDNSFSLKQQPLINGGIVVMDPYTGRVLALSGGLVLKKVSSIDQHRL